MITTKILEQTMYIITPQELSHHLLFGIGIGLIMGAWVMTCFWLSCEAAKKNKAWLATLDDKQYRKFKESRL